MKRIHRTYRFQLRPTQEQKVLLDKHFGCVRFVYNHFLNDRKEQYQANKRSDNYCAQAKTLTGLKKQKETNWLKEAKKNEKYGYGWRLRETLKLLNGKWAVVGKKQAQNFGKK